MRPEFNFTTAAALGLMADCRNDAGGDVGAGGSPDVGAAGGADASLDDSAQVTEPDVNADAAAAQGAAVDDDDEPDLKDDAHREKPWANDPDFKRAMNRARRLQRRLAEAKPIVDKVRAFGVADNLDDVVRRAQRFDEEQTRARRAPGGDSSRADRQPQEYQPPPFDRSSVPFDTNDPAGRWMADYAEQQHNTTHRLIGVVHQMAHEIHSLREGHQGEQRSKEVSNWRTRMDAAATPLPEKVVIAGYEIPLRALVRDAAIGAFHQGKVMNRRVDPQQVLDHYLKKAQNPSKAASSAAAQQRIAENNRALPGRTAFAGGSPTQARDRSQERVKDVTKRLLGRRMW